jgi:hypothetical protein
MTYRHPVELPLDNGLARRRELYLTTRKIHKRQIFKLQAGFEPAIPASEKLQTHALEMAVNRIESRNIYELKSPDSTNTTRFTETENLFMLSELQPLDNLEHSLFVRNLEAS